MSENYDFKVGDIAVRLPQFKDYNLYEVIRVLGGVVATKRHSDGARVYFDQCVLKLVLRRSDLICEVVKEQPTPEDPILYEAKSITDERGKNYGHPKKHFSCTQDLFHEWENCRKKAHDPCLSDKELENGLRHAVYMICDKLARAAENPMHKDNWDDIQGYARCAKMVLGHEK